MAAAVQQHLDPAHAPWRGDARPDDQPAGADHRLYRRLQDDDLHHAAGAAAAVPDAAAAPGAAPHGCRRGDGLRWIEGSGTSAQRAAAMSWNSRAGRPPPCTAPSAGCRRCRATRRSPSPSIAADEPSIAIILRRAGLAGDHRPGHRGGAAGARASPPRPACAPSSPATSGSITRSGSARPSTVRRPRAASRSPYGVTRDAAVEERGIGGGEFQQPTSPVPSASEASFGQLVGDPEPGAPPRRPRAGRRPASSSRTAAVLIDCASASSTRDLAEVAPLEIGRAPVADAHRRVEHRVVRAHALLQRGQPDERLERRAGLPAGQHRAIERALPVVPARRPSRAPRRSPRPAPPPRPARRRPPRPARRASPRAVLSATACMRRRAWSAASRRHPAAPAPAPARPPSRRTSRRPAAAPAGRRSGPPRPAPGPR